MFQAGGPLGPDDVYVTRTADDELQALLARGEFAYVLGPTQLGKTSLALRTMRHFQAQGARCALVDLNDVGVMGTDVEWFNTVISAVRRELGLKRPARRAGADSLAHTPAWVCRTFFEEEVLAHYQQTIVFFDEISVLLELDARRREDFLAALRALHLRRGTVAGGRRRLTFCFLGIASPDQLMRDPARAPFNVATAVRLADFSREEGRRGFVSALGKGSLPEPVFDEVFTWTHGHPYMTQKLCEAMAKRPRSSKRVPKIVRNLVDEFFVSKGRLTESCLSIVEKRISKQIGPLRIYRSLLEGEKVESALEDKAQVALRLAGLIEDEIEGGVAWLRIRNLVFQTVFDLEWVQKRILDLEIHRPLTGPVTLWIASGRHEDKLLRGQALKEARSRAKQETPDLRPDEREFLGACAELEAQTQRRIIAAAVAFVLLVAVAVGARVYLSNSAQLQGAKDAEAELRKSAAGEDLATAIEKARAAEAKLEALVREADEAGSKERAAALHAAMGEASLMIFAAKLADRKQAACAGEKAGAELDRNTAIEALTRCETEVRQRPTQEKCDEDRKKCLPQTSSCDEEKRAFAQCDNERRTALTLSQAQCAENKKRALTAKQAQCDDDKKSAVAAKQAQCVEDRKRSLAAGQPQCEEEKKSALAAKQKQCDEDKRQAVNSCMTNCRAKPCAVQPCAGR